jgi:hypothetical protein
VNMYFSDFFFTPTHGIRQGEPISVDDQIWQV